MEQHADRQFPDLRRKRRSGERIIEFVIIICGAISIITTVAIVYVLVRESWEFFGAPEVDLAAFLSTTTWQPETQRFGIWSLIVATLVTSFIALLVAAPLGLGAAIYLSEYASPARRGYLKPILEVLAGVPTVVYGYFALRFVTPVVLEPLLGEESVGTFNMLSAGITMGIMILPLVASMSEDALSAVPRSLREGAYGLGATRLETSLHVMIPAALSGILAAVIVAMARAVGETMIVALAAGSRPFFTFNPLQAAETMTGYIARISSGDIPYGTIQYTSIFAVALALFFVTLLLNLLSGWMIQRFREVYE